MAQPIHPSDSIVFRTDEIPRIDIIIPADSLSAIIKNIDSNHEFKAQFIFTTSGYIDTVNNIGFRLRGNTSRRSDKKSFKVSFNSFKTGKEFFGLQKMNLNGEHNDPSIMRSFLSWELAESLQIVSTRSNHVDLYINDEYFGLYMNVEHIDDVFLKKRYGHELGNLYKCLNPANLEYLGKNKSLYKQKGYELNLANDGSDFTDLIELTQILSETPTENLALKLEPIFNVNGFIRYLALETFTGHWDAYSFGKNNFYLFKNKLTGKFEFIPYDMDNTFGIDWYGIDWATRNIYQWWNQDENRFLTEKIMGNAAYKDRYSYFLNEIVADYAKIEDYYQLIDDTKERIESSAKKDTYRTMDYGWSYADFQKSFDESLGKHVTYGLKPFIEKRTETIKEQLELNDISPVIENVNHEYMPNEQELKITAQVNDEKVPTVTIAWKLDDEAFVKEVLELVSLDDYSFVKNDLSNSGVFSYYIEASDENGNTTREPMAGVYTCKYGESGTTLRINEFLASNSVSVYDNYGQTEDYIELYNYGTEIIELGDKYLSDNRDKPLKWQLPAISLLPNDFLIIWADDDTKQGDSHANFKLSKSGEFIGLFDSPDMGFLPIDTLSYASQESDVSEGVMDGSILEKQAFLTPGGENNSELVAYVTYAFDLTDLMHAGDFDLEFDYLQVAADYNEWQPTQKLMDIDEDGLLRSSFFGFVSGESIQYQALISGDDQSGNVKDVQELVSGHNYLEHSIPVLSSLSENGIDGVEVYPNPVTQGHFAINAINTVTHYEIRNNLGYTVLKGILEQDTQIVETESLNAGLYLLSLYKGSRLMGSQILVIPIVY